MNALSCKVNRSGVQSSAGDKALVVTDTSLESAAVGIGSMLAALRYGICDRAHAGLLALLFPRLLSLLSERSDS